MTTITKYSKEKVVSHGRQPRKPIAEIEVTDNKKQLTLSPKSKRLSNTGDQVNLTPN